MGAMFGVGAALLLPVLLATGSAFVAAPESLAIAAYRDAAGRIATRCRCPHAPGHRAPRRRAWPAPAASHSAPAGQTPNRWPGS